MKTYEKLGIPDGIEKEADRIYRLIKKSLNNVIYPNNVDKDEIIVLAETNLKIKDLKKRIDIVLILKYYEPIEFPELVSLACGNDVNIKLNDKNKIYINQDSKFFSINVVVGNKIDKDDIIKAIDKGMKRSIVAHELMHFYNNHKKENSSIYQVVTYNSYQLEGFPPIISNFLYLLYYMTSIESIVRPTELYKELLDNKITKDNFEDFMKSSDMIKMITNAKNFSLNSYRKMLNNDPNIKVILNDAKNSEGYKLSDDPSYDMLQLLFINLYNNYAQFAEKNIENFINKIKVLINIFGSNIIDKDKIIDIANNNFETILSKMDKYEKNPIKYFEYLEKMLNFEGNKMFRKLYKLYDMVENTKNTKNTKNSKDSIINWDLHNKINSKSERIIYKFEHFKNKIK